MDRRRQAQSGDDLLPPQYSRPGQLRPEYAVDAVLLAAAEPAESIMRRRPPAPQALFPPREMIMRVQPTINDVLGVGRSKRTGFFSGVVEAAPSGGER